MNLRTDKPSYRLTISHLDTPEVVEQTEPQLFTTRLLEELHKASCWQKQTLAEAAMEIQELLNRLEKTNPTATELEQKAFVTAAISPSCRERFVGALQAGWKETIQEFLDIYYLNIGIATLEAWKVAE